MSTCLQDYVLTITAPASVQMYWKLDQAVAALNTDSVTGQVLFINNFGAVVTGVPAVISNGLQITGGFCNVFESNVAAEYQGNGWTFAFWIRWSSVGTGNEGVQWVFGSAPLQAFTWIIGNGEYHFPYDPGELTGNTPILAADVFHFVVFRYDPGTGNLSYSFDGAAFVDLPGNAGVMPVQATGSGSYILGGNEEVIIDELGAYGFPFTETQKDYLFNGGLGRSFPFSFPP